MNGMIAVVGSRDAEYPYMGPGKFRLFHESDPDNFYYNEMCGHRFLLKGIDRLAECPYVGVEHYRRAFDMTPGEIIAALNENDIIVKNEHGPWGGDTNLSVMRVCSRHHLDYLEQATRWVERWPELEEQASRVTHWGCNMFITTPARFREMMGDEFSYIDRMLADDNLQQSAVAYFCETILTPYIIRKYNKSIAVGRCIVDLTK